MTKVGNSTNYAAGVMYSFSTPTNPPFFQSGNHSFFFKAADRLNTVTKYQSGTTPYPGPYVNTPPVLSKGTVYFQGTTPVFPNAQNVIVPKVDANIYTPLVFQVSYSDQEGTAPTELKVFVSGFGQSIDLHPVAANPDFSGGKTVDFVS